MVSIPLRFGVMGGETRANTGTRGFYWRVAAIGAMSLIPTYAAKVIQRTMKPPSYRKVQGI